MARFMASDGRVSPERPEPTPSPMLGEVKEIYALAHGHNKAEPLRGVQQFTTSEIADLFHKDIVNCERFRFFADAEADGVDLNYLYDRDYYKEVN